MWEDGWSAPVNDAPKQVVRVCVREENAVGSLTCLARHAVDLKSIAECGTYMRISAWIFFLAANRPLGQGLMARSGARCRQFRRRSWPWALEEGLAL